MIQALTREAAVYVLTHLRKDDRDEIEATTWRGEEGIHLLSDTLAARPFAWCAHCDGKPAAIVGASPVRPGVWHAFAFGTDDFKRVILMLTHHVKSIMIPSLVDAGAHRVETYTVATYHKAQRWLELLGATCEATLKKYGRDRQDFLLYVWDGDEWATRRMTAARSPDSSSSS